MEGKNVLKSKTKAKRKMAKELQEVEFVDPIQPKKENSSSSDEEEPENRTQRFYVKKGFVKSGKGPKKSDELQLNPIIKDMIIYKEEHAVEIERKEAVDWGFQAENDFFKEKNQQQKD